MVFESCDAEEPSVGNVLLSPSTGGLDTDVLLTFDLITAHLSSLHVYVTSDVGHIWQLIGSFDDQDNNSAAVFTAESVCVPRASSEVAFVASAPYVRTRAPGYGPVHPDEIEA